jgi:F0F1-type ATP synthase assembly protein I
MKTVRRYSRFARSQRMAIVNGILVIVVLIIIMQMWLFTASMNAFLGGHYAVLLPAALVSLFCLGLIGGLIWYLYRLED